MILGSQLAEDKLLFRTGSPRDASLLKNCICGNNMMMLVAPYGNRVDASVIGTTLELIKRPQQAYTYEEVLSIINKISRFNKIGKDDAKNLLDSARKSLDTQLTFFYPSPEKVRIETMFSYNWISIWFADAVAESILTKIEALLGQLKMKSLKAFSKSEDSLSIHNYEMFGIYLGRSVMDGIGKILFERKVLGQNEAEFFSEQLYVRCLRSVAYMEARQILQNMNINAQLLQNPAQMKKNQQMALKVATMLNKLCKTGKFGSLDPNELTFLYGYQLDIERRPELESKNMLTGCLTALVRQYPLEIQQQFIATGLTDQSAKTAGILDSIINADYDAKASVDEAGF